MAEKKCVPRECKVCGKGFLATQYAVDYGYGQYCGNKCRHQDQRRRQY